MINTKPNILKFHIRPAISARIFAAWLGIHVTNGRGEFSNYNYFRKNNRKVISIVSEYYSFNKEICHELGHYLVASKKRRLHRNYAIPEETSYRKNNQFWNFDEAKSILVENFLKDKFGDKSLKYPLKSIYILREVRKFEKEAMTWWNSEGEKMMNGIWSRFAKWVSV